MPALPAHTLRALRDLRGISRGKGRAILIPILIVFFSVPVIAKTISFTACRQLLNERSFASGEELLQLFSIMYRTNPDGAYAFTRPVLDSLDRVLHTYFPLDELDSVICADRRLSLYFQQRLKTPIPGLFHQAYIHFSDNVVLFVDGDDRDEKCINFHIVSGSIAITTSWLLKVFTPFALDACGTSLFYRMDEAAGTSQLGFRQDVSAPPESLEIDVEPGQLVRVRARHPDMRDNVDLWFRPGALHYFGFTVKLPRFNYIKCTGYKREFKPEAHGYFKQVIADVLAAPEDMFADGVSKHLTLTYYLEERRGEFKQEFGFGIDN